MRPTDPRTAYLGKVTSAQGMSSIYEPQVVESVDKIAAQHILSLQISNMTGGKYNSLYDVADAASKGEDVTEIIQALDAEQRSAFTILKTRADRQHEERILRSQNIEN